MTLTEEPPAVEAPRRFPKLQDFWNRNWVGITIGALLFALIVIYLADRMFISIYPGQAMVLYRRFAVDAVPNEVYYEGFHLVSPWNVPYRYDLSYQQVTVPVIAISKNGLEVAIESSITFRPVSLLLPHLHRQYGPDYKNKLVLPQLRTALQDIVGQFLPEEIYSLSRSSQHQEIFERAQRVIGGVFIDIGDVSIINVRLPAKIEEAIQKKLEAQQVSQMYDYEIETAKKEATRKYEEAKGIQLFQQTISQGISAQVLEWKGIEASLELAKSPNSKVVIFGSGKSGLPLVLGSDADVVKGK